MLKSISSWWWVFHFPAVECNKIEGDIFGGSSVRQLENGKCRRSYKGRESVRGNQNRAAARPGRLHGWENGNHQSFTWWDWLTLGYITLPSRDRKTTTTVGRSFVNPYSSAAWGMDGTCRTLKFPGNSGTKTKSSHSYFSFLSFLFFSEERSKGGGIKNRARARPWLNLHESSGVGWARNLN